MEKERILEEILERLRQRLAETRRTMFASTPDHQETYLAAKATGFREAIAYYDGKATGFAEAIEFVSEVLATEREIAGEKKGEGAEPPSPLNLGDEEKK